MNLDWIDLIQRRLTGTLTEDEASMLQTALKSDAELRRVYLDYMNLDVALASKAASHEVTRELIIAQPMEKAVRVFSWRPLSAAAAGIAFGMLCTSVVYGIVSQRQMQARQLLREGFEKVGMPIERGVPRRLEVWSGDLQSVNAGDGGVQPCEGIRMAYLPPVEERKFSYAFRDLDVSTLPPLGVNEARQIEVTAQFYVPKPAMKNRLQIRLAAFAEDVAGAREIWVKSRLDEQSLLHVSKTVQVDDDTQGWTMVRSIIDVPAEAKVVLISLAAGFADSATPKCGHYLDDVQIRLITHPINPY